MGLLGTLAGMGSEAGAQDEAARRARLIAEIERDAAYTADSTGRPTLDARVMAAMAKVPRERFVPPELRAQAWDNRPLPIGHEQTISQPFIVALMTDLLNPRAGQRVLEIGTGSGYQAAVLAELVGKVYTIEIVAPLAARAAALLAELGYRNVEVRAGDGYRGWPEAAPFDGILVTAAPASVPQPLIDQLALGGRMVIPVGREGSVQDLLVIEKQPTGVVRRAVLPVRFVPFTRSREP
jgi:protein-L-isoaspartate(D-aspartate) O-methyltransferase